MLIDYRETDVSNGMTYNSIILEAAKAHLGVEEWPGAKHNPAILDYFKASGNAHIQDDETPWCAAFVNSVLAGLGLPTNGKLNARSFLDYGESVSLASVKPGDIVVFWRGTPSGWQGHVGFVASIRGETVSVLGGNQGNRVSIAPYPMSKVLGFRRVTGIRDVNRQGRPTLREGDRGVFVADLQGQLNALGYAAGKADGHFGQNTRRAVVQFQSDNKMKADGIVGPKTWEALGSPAPVAPPKPETLPASRIPPEVIDLIEETDGHDSKTGLLNGAMQQLSGAGVSVAAVLAFVQSIDPMVAAALIAAGVLVFVVAMYTKSSRAKKALKSEAARSAILRAME